MSITYVNKAQDILHGIIEVLDRVEETSAGRLFRPTTIGTCRVMEGIKLEDLFKRARKELGIPTYQNLSELNADRKGVSYEIPTELSKDFRRGARAVFDALVARTADNYHACSQASVCETENKLIIAWAVDALKEVSADDNIEWVNIEVAFEEGKRHGLQLANAQMSEKLKGMVEEIVASSTFWQRLKYLFKPSSNTGT